MTGPAVQTLSAAIRSTATLLTRYLDGFDDANATTQTPGLPNHAAWCLGHLALTMHRAAERIGGVDIELAWDPEPFAFGSTPTDRREDYPALDELVRRFHESMDRLVASLEIAGDAGLGDEVNWGAKGGRSNTTKRDLALRMVFHNGLHCGQLVDLRRSLGLDPVIR